MFFRSRFRFAAPLMVAVAMLACSDSTSPPPDTSPKFAAQVSGGAARQLAGSATFSTDVAGETFGLVLLLVERITPGADPLRHGIVIYRKDPGAPALGDYPITEGEAPPNGLDLEIILDGDTTDPMSCIPSSGTIRITSVTADRIRGSFNARATCTHNSGAPLNTPIDVTGTFDAAPGPILEPDIQQPIVGLFDLAAADAQPLPSAVFDDVIPGGDQTPPFRLRVVATSGSIDIDANGHYEQRVTHDVLIDGVLSVPMLRVDRGECTTTRNQLHCESNRLQGVTFTATRTGQTIAITQDLAGEGRSAQYRYTLAR